MTLVIQEKVDRGGEDAFFVSSQYGGIIAVADGVSGYGSMGAFGLCIGRFLEFRDEKNENINK